MTEKKNWKAEVETLETNAKRSSILQSEISQRADQYLFERDELKEEVTDLTSQVCSYVSSRHVHLRLALLLHLILFLLDEPLGVQR